jgi:hypothetical protein
MLQDRGALLTGFGVGLGLMYLLDPDRGRRRRALVRDKMTHATKAGRRAVAATGRDVAHRATGTAARIHRRFRPDSAGDEVLGARIRGRIGRVVSHPHALEVDVSDGLVTLRGPILESEVNNLLHAIERTPGVREVIADFDEYASAANLPALMGGSRRATRSAFWQRSSPTMRLVRCTAGLALAGYGASRRDARGLALAVAGAGLCASAAVQSSAQPPREGARSSELLPDNDRTAAETQPAPDLAR